MNRLTVTFLLSLLASGVANAQTSGFYIGASFLDAETDWLSETDDDSGFEARLGFAFDDNFSMEASYVDLGTVTLPAVSDAGGKADTDGYTASALWSLPISSFNLIGKIGYLWAETDGHIGTISGPVKVSSDEDELFVGAGISYEFSDNFEIRLEYNRSDNFNWASAGINFHF
jgi:opacity protein-like surface antigen